MVNPPSALLNTQPWVCGSALNAPSVTLAASAAGVLPVFATGRIQTDSPFAMVIAITSPSAISVNDVCAQSADVSARTPTGRIETIMPKDTSMTSRNLLKACFLINLLLSLLISQIICIIAELSEGRHITGHCKKVKTAESVFHCRFCH